MNALAQALLGTPPPQAEFAGPPLQKKNGQPYIMYGNSQNNQVWLQNKRLYLPDGRMLSPTELLEGSFDYVPQDIRKAVAADMAVPRTKHVEAPRELTPAEQLEQLDAALHIGVPRYRESRALGIKVRTQLSPEG
jgi:hypothetical protein